MVVIFLFLVLLHAEFALLHWFLLLHHHHFCRSFMSGWADAPVLRVIHVDGHGLTLSQVGSPAHHRV